MLTVLTNIVRTPHERVGSGSHNKPELRQKMIIKAIQKQFGECNILYSSKTIQLKWLEQIHDPDYLVFLEDAYSSWLAVEDPDWVDATHGLIPNHFTKRKPLGQGIPTYKMSGYYGADYMSPIFKDTFQNAMIAAQQSYRAAEIACNNYNTVVYALCCSPGHHAKYQEYSGYCYINNAVVAAYRMIELGKKKVAILDLDFHASDGCAELVHSNKLLKDRVYSCSVHVDPVGEFPSFYGYPDDYPENKSIKNIIVNANSNWEQYESCLIDAIEYLNKLELDGLVIAFGADTYKDDPDASPLARLNLELEDYDKMGQLVRKHFSNIPVVVTQEGGYNIEKVGEIVCRFLQNLVL